MQSGMAVFPVFVLVNFDTKTYVEASAGLVTQVQELSVTLRVKRHVNFLGLSTFVRNPRWRINQNKAVKTAKFSQRYILKTKISVIQTFYIAFRPSKACLGKETL